MSEKPKRVQLSRQKGWKMPANTAKVDRATRFGNPVSCSWPYGCPYSPEFERDAWADEDGSISPYRCCVDAFRHYVETGQRGEPTRTGYLSLGLEGLAGYPNRKKLIAGLPELRGKNLACWCAHDRPCHADVLLEVANPDAALSEESA